MSPQITFSLRLQIYNVLIHQFDSIESKFMLSFVKSKLYVKVTFSDTLTKTNYLNDYVKLLNFEWNHIQRFRTLTQFKPLHTFQITLRKSNFFIFLDNYINFMFTDKNFIIYKNNCYWTIKTWNSIQWNYFNNHLALFTTLSQTKEQNLLIQHIIHVYVDNSFFYSYWIPYKTNL